MGTFEMGQIGITLNSKGDWEPSETSSPSLLHKSQILFNLAEVEMIRKQEDLEVYNFGEKRIIATNNQFRIIEAVNSLIEKPPILFFCYDYIKKLDLSEKIDAIEIDITGHIFMTNEEIEKFLTSLYGNNFFTKNELKVREVIISHKLDFGELLLKLSGATLGERTVLVLGFDYHLKKNHDETEADFYWEKIKENTEKLIDKLMQKEVS
jgi:hypothetical protein